MVDNPISTEQILKNIYGVTATGTVSNMSGGNINKKYINIDNIQRAVLRDDVVNNNIRIKYLDEKPVTNIMTGGRRTRKTRKLKAGSKAKDIVIYASPEYVESSSDLRLFMDKFFLYYRFSRSPNSAIYIIPPSAELSKMINKRSKDKPEGSMELQKDVRSNKNIGLEKYLFVTFGDNSKSDKYRIDPNLNSKEAYPNSPFETIRRTNLNGDVFYISYKDDKSVVIHTKPDNVNSKDSETLNFVARFNNGGYIFQGSIPDHSEEHIGPKQIKKSKLYKFAFDEMEFGDIPINDYNARSAAITGGASNNSLKAFELYDRLYNYDHDVAAEHFLRCAAKKDKLPKNIINNADFLYSAIYYALSKPNAVNANDINKEISSKEFMKLYKDFKPMRTTISECNKKKMAVTSDINNAYHNYVIGKYNNIRNNQFSTNAFIKHFKNWYRKTNDWNIPIADIMTGYIRNNDKPDIQHVGEELYNAINDTDNSNISYGICSVINNSIKNSFAPSLIGKYYPPVFASVMDVDNFERAVKKHRDNNDDNVDAAIEMFDNQQQLEGGDEQIDGADMKQFIEKSKEKAKKTLGKIVEQGKDFSDQIGLTDLANKTLEQGKNVFISTGQTLTGELGKLVDKGSDKIQETSKEFITKTSEKTGKLIDNFPTPGSTKSSYTEQSSNNSLAMAAKNALENDIPSDGDDIEVINDEDDNNINNFISRYVN